MSDEDFGEHRVISHSALRDEMMAVARGEKPAPDYAGKQTFESVEALEGSEHAEPP